MNLLLAFHFLLHAKTTQTTTAVKFELHPSPEEEKVQVLRVQRI